VKSKVHYITFQQNSVRYIGSKEGLNEEDETSSLTPSKMFLRRNELRETGKKSNYHRCRVNMRRRTVAGIRRWRNRISTQQICHRPPSKFAPRAAARRRERKRFNRQQKFSLILRRALRTARRIQQKGKNEGGELGVRNRKGSERTVERTISPTKSTRSSADIRREVQSEFHLINNKRSRGRENQAQTTKATIPRSANTDQPLATVVQLKRIDVKRQAGA
jgi:hypothetical protein